jgi:hypothetical protein
MCLFLLLLLLLLLCRDQAWLQHGQQRSLGCRLPGLLPCCSAPSVPNEEY